MGDKNQPKVKVNESFDIIIKGKKEEIQTLASNRRAIKSKSRESDGQRS